MFFRMSPVCRAIFRNLKPVLILSLAIVPCGCGAAYHRDKSWNDKFLTSPGYQGYVEQQLADKSGWVAQYYTDLKTAGTSEDQKVADRNRVVNGYLLIADTAYSKFQGGYNDQIAYFEIASDLVNLGLTAASAVTPPAALLGAAATGSLGVQHSVEKNGLNSQTRFVITNRMGAIRDRQRAIILKRELEPVSCPTPVPSAGNTTQTAIVSDVCYSLEDGMRDVNAYFYLGTISQALADINSETAQISTQTQQNTRSQAQPPAAPTITSANADTFTVGTARSFTVKATGSPTPTFSQIGALPGGVKFTDNKSGTATLAGTPAAGTAGSYPITITAQNASGADATQTFTLTVH